MPAYNSSPYNTVYGLVEGQPAYSMGTPPIGGQVKMLITKFSLTTNVATITVLITEGQIPLVNDLITVLALPVAAANVTNVAIASVSITASTGIGTITYAATNANVVQENVAARAISIPQPQPEATLANTAGQAFAIPRKVPASITGRPITLNVQTPSAPGNLKCNLQVAISNSDAEYVSLGTDLTAAGTTLFNAPDIYNFVRYKDTGSNGTTGNVIAKILI